MQTVKSPDQVRMDVNIHADYLSGIDQEFVNQRYEENHISPYTPREFIYTICVSGTALEKSSFSKLELASQLMIKQRFFEKDDKWYFTFRMPHIAHMDAVQTSTLKAHLQELIGDINDKNPTKKNNQRDVGTDEKEMATQ